MLYDVPYSRHSPPSKLELTIVDKAIVVLAKRLKVYSRSHTLTPLTTAADFDNASPPLPKDNLQIRIGILFKNNNSHTISESAVRSVTPKKVE